MGTRHMAGGEMMQCAVHLPSAAFCGPSLFVLVMAATGHGPLIIVLFLCLAACTQLLLALYGLLSRYAQV